MKATNECISLLPNFSVPSLTITHPSVFHLPPQPKLAPKFTEHEKHPKETIEKTTKKSLKPKSKTNIQKIPNLEDDHCSVLSYFPGPQYHP